MLCLLGSTKICRIVCQLEVICDVERWILKNLLLIKNPRDLHLSVFPSGNVVSPSENSSTRVLSSPNPVSATVGRDSEAQVGESSVTPGSTQIYPRDLTRGQGELARMTMTMTHSNEVSTRVNLAPRTQMRGS